MQARYRRKRFWFVKQKVFRAVFAKRVQISNLTLFGVCLASACVRYWVKLHVQRQFSVDDGILLFGIMCSIAATVLMIKFVDTIFLERAVQTGMRVKLPSNLFEQVVDNYTLETVAWVLTWCSIAAVKFSYLFLFKRMISRIPHMSTYWWFTAGFNGVISVYGIVANLSSCPYYGSQKVCKRCPSALSAATMTDSARSNLLLSCRLAEDFWIAA